MQEIRDMGTVGRSQSGADTRLRDYAALAAQLSCPVRLELLMLLARGGLCVSRLRKILRLEQAHVSHHLGKLREGGLVDYEEDGQLHIYALVPQVQVVDDGGVPMLSIHTALGECRFRVLPFPADGRESASIEVKPSMEAESAKDLPRSA